MHVNPAMVPTDLKEPAMDAGYPPDIDPRETCGFWYSREGKCRIGPLSLELGGPCPDCPEA
jgi:hypothetical protein